MPFIPLPPQCGKGMLRVIRCSEYGKADIVPVDLVNNMVISVGWITGVNPTPQPIIYHYSSGTLNPINWLGLCEWVWLCGCGCVGV